jgi:hypothetical protein
VTCSLYGFNIGGSCYAACNFIFTQFYYQQDNNTGIYANKYCSEYNCLATSCDFSSCSYPRASLYSTCYLLDSSCGTGSDLLPCFSYSDIRLKTKIETITDALEKIMKIEAVEYDWNTNLDESSYDYFKRNNKLHAIGLIAQNVRLYFPEVVSINKEGYYFIDYNKLNSALVEAIKSQQLSIEDVKEKINELENQIINA